VQKHARGKGKKKKGKKRGEEKVFYFENVMYHRPMKHKCAASKGGRGENLPGILGAASPHPPTLGKSLPDECTESPKG